MSYMSCLIQELSTMTSSTVEYVIIGETTGMYVYNLGTQYPNEFQLPVIHIVILKVLELTQVLMVGLYVLATHHIGKTTHWILVVHSLIMGRLEICRLWEVESASMLIYQLIQLLPIHCH